MTTALAEAPAEQKGLASFNITDESIAELREKYMGLTIRGVEDKKGYADVHAARMLMVSTRTGIEKTRKTLNDAAQAHIKKVNTEAKRLTGLLEPIEAHLSAEETAIDEAKEQAKRAAEEARRAKLQTRLDALQAVNCIANPLTVEAMTDGQFQEALDDATAEAEARRKAEAEAAERRKQEEAALAKERERLAEIQRQQQAEADRLAAERKRLADEEAARQHAAQEKADREAAEAARIKAEEERPHRERIVKVADAVDLIQVPEGPLSQAVCEVLQGAARRIRQIAQQPLKKSA